EERVDRSRAGRVQGRQPAAANHDDPAGLAVAATPACLGAQSLVPRAGPAPRRADAQDDPRRSVEVHIRRRGHRGRRDEDRLTSDPPPILTDLIGPDGSRWPNRNVRWPHQPIERMVPASRAPPAERGIMVQPLRAVTACELDLVCTSSGHGNGLRPWMPYSPW